jgi:hypothetical protein
MEDEVGEAVEVVDLGTLAEVLGVLHRQRVEAEVLAQQVAGLRVQPLQVQPEERARAQPFPHRAEGGLDALAVRLGQLALHATNSPLPEAMPPPHVGAAAP